MTAKLIIVTSIKDSDGYDALHVCAKLGISCDLQYVENAEVVDLYQPHADANHHTTLPMFILGNTYLGGQKEFDKYVESYGRE